MLSSLHGLLFLKILEILEFLKKGVAIMAKNKADKWRTPEGLVLLEGWARDGLLNSQIAYNMGVSESSLYDYINRYPEIKEALSKGKEVVDYMVESALVKSALEGNTTSMIFFLKNRRPDKWRDKRDVDITSEQVNKLDNLIKDIREGVGVDDTTDT